MGSGPNSRSAKSVFREVGRQNYQLRELSDFKPEELEFEHPRKLNAAGLSIEEFLARDARSNEGGEGLLRSRTSVLSPAPESDMHNPQPRGAGTRLGANTVETIGQPGVVLKRLEPALPLQRRTRLTGVGCSPKHRAAPVRGGFLEWFDPSLPADTTRAPADLSEVHVFCDAPHQELSSLLTCTLRYLDCKIPR
jgi:hypothetical protein